ncbi:AAA family ATPase, partial [Paraglaciecola sp.]|uniref:AAA family ATPase n=1 Tax=Paraglaciecola sp. TaxID=1920173 RepID=UPI003EFAECBD
FLDNAKGNAFLDTLNGDEVAEILKENEKLTSKVNGWFEKFDLKVNVEHLEDVIHKLQVTQNSLDLDITDVGFGVSQVLPVIIQGFLSPKNSLTLIEQPEIHLHPQMQAELADLFIDITDIDKDEASKYLLIETHSEYLLKRLRRRIAEGKISASDIAIHSISPQEGQTGANISMLEIESKGSFDWPKDFYGGELMRDTTEFLRNQ